MRSGAPSAGMSFAWTGTTTRRLHRAYEEARGAMGDGKPIMVICRHGEGQGRKLYGAFRAVALPHPARGEEYEAALKELGGRQAMRDTFTRCLEAYAETHPELVLVTGDLGFGVLFPYMKKFPDRFINAGISEQAMMSMAAGMALEGKTVVVYSIGNFPTLRCLEQIRNCCAYHEVNVKIVCVGAGFVYGHAGHDPSCHGGHERAAHPAGREGVRPRRRRGDGGRDGPPSSASLGWPTCASAAAASRISTRTGRWAGYRCGQALEQFPGTGRLYPHGRRHSGERRGSRAPAGGGRPACGRGQLPPPSSPWTRSICPACAAGRPLLFTLEEHTIVGGFGGAGVRICLRP